MKGFILEAPLLGGCLEAWLAAYQVSRLAKPVHAKNTPLSLFWQCSNPAEPGILARIRNLCGSSTSMTRAGSGLLSSSHLQDPFVTSEDS